MDSSVASALSALQHETGLPVVFGGIVTTAASRFTIAQVRGARTTALQRLGIDAGRGLGGRVLAAGRIAAVGDYLTDANITHQYDAAVQAEGLRSIIGVPVAVEGRVRAVLYGAVRAPVQFGSVLARQAGEVARRAAFEIAVAEETERRMRTIETAAAIRAAGERVSASKWEAVRVAHAQLRELAGIVDDAALSARLEGIVAQLGGGARTPLSGTLPSAVLSGRETDVLALVAVGCTNIEIAERLGLERETVKGYLRNAMRKLDAHRRTQAVTRARMLGLLP